MRTVAVCIFCAAQRRQQILYLTEARQHSAMPQLIPDPKNAEQYFRAEFRRLLIDIDQKKSAQGNLVIGLQRRNSLVNFLTINPDRAVCLEILNDEWPGSNFEVVKLQAEHMEFKSQSIDSFKIDISEKFTDAGIYEYSVSFAIQKNEKAPKAASSCTLQ